MNIIENKDKSAKETVAYKIIVVGDSGVGKTNFINRFLGNEFQSNSLSTIGVELFSKIYDINIRINEIPKEDTIKVNVWDTAGQERYKSVTSSYYKGSKGVFVLYDTTKSETFKNVDGWLKDIAMYCNYNPIIMIVGTKSDLYNLKIVETEDLEAKSEKYSKI